MKKILYACIISMVFIQCEKNDLADPLSISSEQYTYSDFIVAGDSNNISIYKLNEKIELLNDGDTIPDLFEGSVSESEDSPLDIDENNKLDIRFGAQNFLTYNMLIYRSLYFSNNYGNQENYEFAIMKSDTIGMSNKSIKVAKLFSLGDTISSNSFWCSANDPSKISNLYFISYYYNDALYNRIFNTQDSVQISNRDLYINKSGLNRFIGVRKKVVNDFIYGYIQINFDNYDNFELKASAFADK